MVVMYLCNLNIERAKNFGGNFHVNELLKRISLQCWPHIVKIHENSPQNSLRAQCSICINTYLGLVGETGVHAHSKTNTLSSCPFLSISIFPATPARITGTPR